MSKPKKDRKKQKLHMPDIPNPIPMPGKVDAQTRAQRKTDLRDYFILGMLAVVVGIIGGFAAIVFRNLINFIHNLFFLGNASVVYDSYQFMDYNLGWLSSNMVWFVVLIPMIGGLLVGLIVRYGASEV